MSAHQWQPDPGCGCDVCRVCGCVYVAARIEQAKGETLKTRDCYYLGKWLHVGKPPPCVDPDALPSTIALGED